MQTISLYPESIANTLSDVTVTIFEVTEFCSNNNKIR